MCGIVGLFFKNKSLEPHLGELFGEMLDCMSSRGTDSAGFAVYGPSVPEGSLKVTLQHADEEFTWARVAKAFENELKAKASFTINSSHAIFVIEAKEPVIRQFLQERFP